MPRHATRTSFKKGHIPWSKGKKVGPHSEETKEKIRKGVKENLPSTIFKKGMVPWFKQKEYKIENHPNFKNGKFSIKRRLLRDRKCCENCNNDNKFVLEVHHIDRKKENNKLENLKLLCANCHTMEHIGAGD